MAPSAITTTFEEYAPAPVVKSIVPFDTTSPVTYKAPNYNVAERSKLVIGEALKRRVQSINQDTCEAGEEDPFFVVDLGEVYRQHLRWKLNLPRVKPHYAVKCNPAPGVLRLLAALGTGFDCASRGEIEQVLSMGVDPSRIIYANPCKTKSYIKYSQQNGVKQMTFDNADELYKVQQHFPDAELFLRIATDDSGATSRLSLKFGAPMDTVRGLLDLARELGLNIVGVAFHVGSGSTDPLAYLKAVRDARWVFDQAEEVGYTLKTLDIGGGFVPETFEGSAATLSEALETYMPAHVRIIGEPGRYYVSRAFTVAAAVIARRPVHDEETNKTSYMLYLNDGVYGNFSNIIFDHQAPQPKLLRIGNRNMYNQEEENYGPEFQTDYSLWGPTCDSIDCISKESSFQTTIDIGDWLYFENMGAYTRASATAFNGFSDKHDVIYVSSERAAAALMDL
ncbi:ornithine decarboxylase [Patellaria atrata CBS 101060]|uniref:Ornithine decarboxylase n=1 Tax=Patellaria atrata CBS 101060 TaxID=1346257 RepID=A0A9P4VVD7_9PEZI|nr:ornithine decarboxylase [Patellaria atrata CBS 101060]